MVSFDGLCPTASSFSLPSRVLRSCDLNRSEWAAVAVRGGNLGFAEDGARIGVSMDPTKPISSSSDSMLCSWFRDGAVCSRLIIRKMSDPERLDFVSSMPDFFSSSRDWFCH